MDRIITFGLSLLAVVAFGAVASSSAFAGEYGACAKTAKVEIEYKSGTKTRTKSIYNGRYADKNCTDEAQEVQSLFPGAVKKGAEELAEGNNGKYAWEPYPAKAPVETATSWEYTSKGKESTLESATGKITCAKNADVGKITGVKADDDTITFEDCANSVFGTACYNVEATKEGKKGGTIVTFPDDTVLIDHGEHGASGGEPAEGEAWEEFVGTGSVEVGPGETFERLLASFVCKTPLGEDPFYVTGTVSGVISPVDTMSKKALVSFGVSKGEQDELAVTLDPETLKLEPFPSTQTAEDQVKGASKIEIATKDQGAPLPPALVLTPKKLKIGVGEEAEVAVTNPAAGSTTITGQQVRFTGGSAEVSYVVPANGPQCEKSLGSGFAKFNKDKSCYQMIKRTAAPTTVGLYEIFGTGRSLGRAAIE